MPRQRIRSLVATLAVVVLAVSYSPRAHAWEVPTQDEIDRAAAALMKVAMDPASTENQLRSATEGFRRIRDRSETVTSNEETALSRPNRAPRRGESSVQDAQVTGPGGLKTTDGATVSNAEVLQALTKLGLQLNALPEKMEQLIDKKTQALTHRIEKLEAKLAASKGPAPAVRTARKSVVSVPVWVVPTCDVGVGTDAFAYCAPTPSYRRCGLFARLCSKH
jgi:hypothetical protein